jgi:hypothetical protein
VPEHFDAIAIGRSAVDVPRPIAERTHRYIAGCGIPSLEIGRPQTTAREARP